MQRMPMIVKTAVNNCVMGIGDGRTNIIKHHWSGGSLSSAMPFMLSKRPVVTFSYSQTDCF